MLEIFIPGAETLRLEYLVADFNGTLACDGVLLPGVGEALVRLAEKLAIHMMRRTPSGGRGRLWPASLQSIRIPVRLLGAAAISLSAMFFPTASCPISAWCSRKCARTGWSRWTWGSR